MNSVLIRPATPGDIPSMRALEQQSESAAHWAEREYDALFAAGAPPRVSLVAIENESQTMCGFAIARCATDEWEIENVVVALEERKRGMGSRLIGELLVRARSAGATSVLLEVRESNRAARRLYEKLGFSQQARRSSYYRDPEEDALQLHFSGENLRQFYLEGE